MNLQQRIDVLLKLKTFIEDSSNEKWVTAKENAARENPWFTNEFIELSIKNICAEFLAEEKLTNWVKQYHIPEENKNPKIIGVVMAGNIPLVGFHDFLCVFITGHKILIKPSSKDEILLKALVDEMIPINTNVSSCISFANTLKNCDAYIATGSNNSSRYFEYYFSKYPSIIRRNRTSVAVLEGNESIEQLELLAGDIQLYFGLGCRNVTKLYVPIHYDFLKLLAALKKYEYIIDFHKYKHNYDYQLALLMMNNKHYMNNGSVVLSENTSVFSAISHLHYEYYTNKQKLTESLVANDDIQCIVGHGFITFGKAQQPSLMDYADDVDTIQFLMNL